MNTTKKLPALVLAAALAGCGGGSLIDPQCASLAAPMPLAEQGAIVALKIDNPSDSTLRYTVSGSVSFDGAAPDVLGQYGGESVVLLNAGGVLSTVARPRADPAHWNVGTGSFSAAVEVAPGGSANVTLEHRPSPYPFRWERMTFTAAELCATSAAL